ncbi:unnamed protein product [Gongylonema pulchrum]|uniref:BPI2 domain-containing protein n=1 Tax=Gongylonema pulchrum TaxID=637853 RepID=A0A183DNH9_9BILA|nr:unnamed protein product [Gongylonema pulchrum]
MVGAVFGILARLSEDQEAEVTEGETNARILALFFEQYSNWFGALLDEGLSSETFEQKLRIGHIRASNFRVAVVNVQPAIMLFDDGGYHIQASVYHPGIRSPTYLYLRQWNKMHSTHSSSLKFEHFTHSVTKPTLLFRPVHTFLDRAVRLQMERAICRTAVSVLDSFLKNAIERISVRHLLRTGKFSLVMNNALVGQPQVTDDGDLITYHAGVLDGESSSSELSHDGYMRPDDALHILRSLPQRDVAGFSDDAGCVVTVSCIEMPEVIVEEDKIFLKMKQNYQFLVNDSLVLDETESRTLLLNVQYSYSLQLYLRLADSFAWTFSDDKLKACFGSRLHHHVASLITDQLVIPLPSVRDTVARKGFIMLKNGYVIFSALLFTAH